MEFDIDQATGLVRRPAPNPYPHGPSWVRNIPLDPVGGDPLHPALIDGDREWSYRDLSSAVDTAGTALHDLGVKPGDRIAWSLPNCAELPIGFVGTQLVGGVWLGINMPLAAPEKRFLLDDSGASLFISTPEILDEVGPADGRTDITYEQWCERLSTTDPVPGPAINDTPHIPAAIAYTSGTTGKPKGAVHSQHNLMWPGLVTKDTHPPTARDRQGTPLAHTILNMLVLGVVSAWARGTTGVILHHTDAARFAAEVKEHQVTRTTLVPTIVHDLVHRDGIDPESLRSLELIIVGGAGTPAPVRRAFLEKFGVRAINGYGLSEAPSGIVRESAAEPIDDRSAGYPMAPFRLSIVDEHDQELPCDTEGEICVAPATAGPWAGCWSPMLGYWRRPAATAEVLRGGVLHTGDVGMLDGNGRLTISGRRSELILRGGANVYPVEVETVLANHPDVAEVAVYGVPDDRLGQRVAAAIVGSRREPDVDAIRKYCADHIASYKVPDTIDVRDSLPRNSMGKVVKGELG